MEGKNLSLKEVASLWKQSLPSSTEKFIRIPLDSFRYIDISALLSLCSLVEYNISLLSKQCHIIYPQLRPEFLYHLSTMASIQDPHNLQLYFNNHGILASLDDCRDGLASLKFLSFLQHIGFTSLWEDESSSGKVQMLFFPRDKSKELFIYGGLNKIPPRFGTESYRRYTTTHKIEGPPQVRKTILKNIVLDMEMRFPAEQIDMPLFKDMEFENVFLRQLAENVASHANTRAFLIARSHSQEDLSKRDKPDELLPNCSQEIKEICFKNGFFEIIISDCGRGIPETLRDAYYLSLKEILKCARLPQKESLEEEQNVTEFSLDEFGSRYLSSDNYFAALIESHTLNQVFQYTRKYGGSLRIMTNNTCLSFDTCGDIKRGQYGMGFLGHREAGNWFHQGVHVSVILPHKPRSLQKYPKARSNEWVSKYPPEKQIPDILIVSTYFGPNPNMAVINKKCSEMIKWALQENIDKLVLDFSDTANWNITLILKIFSNIENLILHITCWGINFPSIHIESLKSRWNKFEPPTYFPEEYFGGPMLR